MDHDKLEALRGHALKGRYFEVQSLLNEGVDPNGKNSDGETALMMAAEWSHSEVVELLINSGADIHCCDRHGWTVLHHASRAGSAEIVRSLVNKGVTLDMKTCYGNTPLIIAAVSSRTEVVELLINSGADIHGCDHRGWTVLHFASDRRWVDIVKCLVNKGIALDKKECYGRTPLFFAVKKFVLEEHDIEIADCLLQAGADPNVEDNNGISPFNILIKENKIYNYNIIDTVKICIEKGAYLKSTDFNRLLKDPLLRKAILQDIQLCSQAFINKFNNKDLPLLYKGLASSQKLPHIGTMKIGHGSGMALEVEQAVTHEIQAKGFCNLFKMFPLVLGMLCVKSSLENSRSVFNQASLSRSQNGLKRLGNNKQEFPCKKCK